VAELLRAARVLSWPLVVDGESGLILDGSHRAVVLARELGARFARAATRRDCRPRSASSAAPTRARTT